jgi:hypothetical protein
MMLLPVGASIPQPVTGDERGGMMTVVLILLGASAVLMIAFAALSGKKGKKK